LRGGGGTSILLPGLGLIISTPALIVLFLILNIVVVIAAAITKPRREFVNKTTLKRNFKYSNNIFGGCGNGVLDLSLAKDPNNYNTDADRGLEICITDSDLTAVQDFVILGRIKYENLKSNEEFQKAAEHNRKIFQNFASEYPMLGRIDDIYQDYVFDFEEIQKLLDECLKLQSQKPNAAADLALRKLIYACDEALKENSYLVFSGD